VGRTTRDDEEAKQKASLRCASCGAEYIAGTTLCAACMGTDLRPIPRSRTHHRAAWWIPLLIPAVIIPLLTIDKISRGTYVFHSNPGLIIFGWIEIVVFLGLSAFVAGRRYERSHRE
jgi:hypothetical protein